MKWLIFIELVLRLISSETEIRLASLRSGQITSDDWIKLTDFTANLADLKIFIDDNFFNLWYLVHIIELQLGLELLANLFLIFGL